MNNNKSNFKLLLAKKRINKYKINNKYLIRKILKIKIIIIMKIITKEMSNNNKQYQRQCQIISQK